MNILLLEDEESLRLAIRDELSDRGHTVMDYAEANSVLEILAKHNIDCILSDIKMPGMSGFELLKKVKTLYSDLPVILMTAYPETSAAVQCMKEGAYDYIIKPVEAEKIAVTIEKLASFTHLKRENTLLKAALEKKYGIENIIGKCHPMLKIFENVINYAQSEAPVLIEGETGTGKELIADAIHYNSLRKGRPFVKINCGVFSKELIESELFGHEKGSFTGAIKSKRGRFEAANGGTIFLDEIDDLSLDIQQKLLRALQNHEIEKVGSESGIKVDIRIIAATKTDLKLKIQEGLFREDFYYRLHVLPLRIPPLRERTEDIPLLINHFLNKYVSGRTLRIDNNALNKLIDYPWPGNIRELEHVIEHLTIITKSDTIAQSDLPPEILGSHRKIPLSLMKSTSYDLALKEFEILFLSSALKQTMGNKKKAAQNINLPYSTFRHRLDKLGLQ